VSLNYDPATTPYLAGSRDISARKVANDDGEPAHAGPAIGEAIGAGVERSDFQAFMPAHAYIFVPSGELWPASSVNSRIPPIEDGLDKEGKPKFISAAAWLDRNRPVEQMTWAPGQLKVIRDRLISDGDGSCATALPASISIESQRSGAATPRRPDPGSNISGEFIPTTPTT
jgi:hypothetical protein